jgi:hypothetical protein
MKQPDYQIPKHALIYIEGELRLYETYRQRINKLMEDYQYITKETHVPEVSSYSGPGNLTESTALQLKTILDELAEKRTRVDKIESGLRIISKAGRKIIEGRYFSEDCYNDEELIDSLHYGYRNTYFRDKKEAQYKIGIMLGVIL